MDLKGFLCSLTTSFTHFFAAIKKALGSRDVPGLPCNNPEELLLSLANLCEDHMGGSSGVVSCPSCNNSPSITNIYVKTMVKNRVQMTSNYLFHHEIIHFPKNTKH